RGLTLLTRLGRRLGVAPAPEAVARRLAAAGAPAAITPGDVMAAKTGAALVALVLVVGPATTAPGRLGPFALVVAPLAAASAPELWLRRRARARARLMAREVADVLDLLRVCVEAGRPPTSALAEVGARHRGLLGAEIRRAARELELGRPRTDVLDQLAARCPVAELATLTAALRRADRHGAPLAPALRSLAQDARAARARAVREQAAKAAPKIQLVIALLLVPAVMLLVGAALASAFGAGG
ncbi:MAG: type II secretion system F family protein, partial [Solirubrobacteraceae bacterium]